MRRDGQTDRSSGTGFFGKLAWMVGGVGVGAGLLYFLDPQQGQKRRKSVTKGFSDIASTAGDYAGSAWDTTKSYLGSAGEAVSSTTGSVSSGAQKMVQKVGDWMSQQSDTARQALEKQVCGQTRTQHRIGVSICALSSMALGAALMYIFDPSTGASRRHQLGSQISDYSRRAGSAIKSGTQYATDKAKDLASSVGGATGMAGSQKSESETPAAQI